ncbi:DCC1-like thiol-disulfide oxidoreductase family protein [Leptothoe kymatousa]|uniref:DCC1-like thiol-disulfide oxidoreductase family protein n=1 Tax=Leptothoe kymatousa TaxID=2651727 RepID=UPI001C023819|nr:DCC1-like thiol-disulfide oxidoreductase family protein [Leptothoe kymatousa]
MERLLGVVFSFDLRSLALFRIGLALALLGQLGTMAGRLPMVGPVVLTLAALLLLIGYRTRWVTIVAWGLLVLFLGSGGLGATLAAVFFWAMFLPLGSCYAVDQALNTSPRPQSKQVFTAANLGLLLQLVLMAIVLGRTGGGWWLVGVTGLALIPSPLWDRWPSFTPQQLGLKIYYDADCGFCKKLVHLLRTFLVLPRRIPLQIAQGDPVIHTAMETHNSWVIVDWQGQHHYKWHGIAYVVSLSPMLWPLAWVLRWSPLMAVGNRIYETIANNRRFAGNFTKPFKFQSFTAEASPLFNLATWCMFLVVAGTYLYRLMNHGDILSQHPVSVALHQMARLIP